MAPGTVKDPLSVMIGRGEVGYFIHDPGTQVTKEHLTRQAVLKELAKLREKGITAGIVPGYKLDRDLAGLLAAAGQDV